MFEFKSAKPRRDALNCVNAVDILVRRLTWKHEWKNTSHDVITQSSTKTVVLRPKIITYLWSSSGPEGDPRAVVLFFLLNLADPKYTRSLRGDVSSPACVRTLKCFHLDLFTPAWSQRSLKVEDGTGTEFFLLFARPTPGTRLCSALQPTSQPGGGSRSIARGKDADTWEPTRYKPHLSKTIQSVWFWGLEGGGESQLV